jgi:hypothetical protein
MGGAGLGFARSPLKLLEWTAEERGFDEGQGVQPAARTIIQEPLFFLLEL